MEDLRIEKIEDVIPVVRRHLVPQIERAVNVCISAYEADHFNDNYTFGTHFWRNTWNRISHIAHSGDTLLEPHGKVSDYKFRIGSFILRHHRVGGEYHLPRSARSAKREAIQLNLFGPVYPEVLPGENFILAIEVEPDEGLKDVFIGELKQNSTTEKFCWERKIPVFTPGELSILKGSLTQRPPEKEALTEVQYQQNEAEPGEIVTLDDESDVASKLKDGKIDA